MANLQFNCKTTNAAKSAPHIKKVNSQGLFTSDGKGYEAAVGARKVAESDVNRRAGWNHGAGCRGVQTNVGEGQTDYTCGFEGSLFGCPCAQQTFFVGAMNRDFFGGEKTCGHAHKLLPGQLYVHAYRPSRATNGKDNSVE